MADPTSPKSGGGCFSKLLFLVLLIAAGCFATAIFFISRPQDYSDVVAATAKTLPQRELKTVLKSAIDRGYAVTLSEAEINQWLGRTLVAKQGGPFSDKVTLNRVWVRLEKDQAEVIMSRTVMGKPFTISMFLQVERMEDTEGSYTEVRPQGGTFHPDFPRLLKGGRFGQLVIPQGFLILVMPAYEKLAALFPEEIELAFKEMSRIRIEEGQITLDPREPTGHQGMPSTF
ncbi:MAG: hypothetical protein EOP88_24810 [Verrucomicrobiaceae bacterium]|nr:MAG: hypothetical protein EOP88_24810 [Verrucomicrobiaceae bacterium]